VSSGPWFHPPTMQILIKKNIAIKQVTHLIFGRSSQFKFWPGDQLFWLRFCDFTWYSQPNSGTVPQIRLQMFPLTSIPVHSLIIIPFNAVWVWSELRCLLIITFRLWWNLMQEIFAHCWLVTSIFGCVDRLPGLLYVKL
jgi:hypothetical protein